MTAPKSEPSELRAAAQAVVDRWDMPLWKDVPATAVFINRLRAALTPTPAQPEPQHVDSLWPIVNLKVSDEGKTLKATFYAPGLPDGLHDLYPCQVFADAPPQPPTLSDAQCDAIQNALETALAAKEYVTLIEARALLRAAIAQPPTA